VNAHEPLGVQCRSDLADEGEFAVAGVPEPVGVTRGDGRAVAGPETAGGHVVPDAEATVAGREVLVLLWVDVFHRAAGSRRRGEPHLEPGVLAASVVDGLDVPAPLPAPGCFDRRVAGVPGHPDRRRRGRRRG